jgi:hypothetical protein
MKERKGKKERKSVEEGRRPRDEAGHPETSRRETSYG